VFGAHREEQKVAEAELIMKVNLRNEFRSILFSVILVHTDLIIEKNLAKMVLLKHPKWFSKKGCSSSLPATFQIRRLFSPWAPAGMGKGNTCPLWKCCKVFLCIAKRPVDELFIHYFHNLSSSSRGFAPDPTGAPSLDPTAGLSYPDPNLPTPGKKYPAGTRVYVTIRYVC